MKRRRTLVDDLMAEYIAWGGPIVTRAEAYRDCVSRGIPPRDADYLVFARHPVTAPTDPVAQLDFLRQIQALGDL